MTNVTCDLWRIQPPVTRASVCNSTSDMAETKSASKVPVGYSLERVVFVERCPRDVLNLDSAARESPAAGISRPATRTLAPSRHYQKSFFSRTCALAVVIMLDRESRSCVMYCELCEIESITCMQCLSK